MKTLPFNHRETKTRDQQAFLAQYQGKPDYERAAFCIDPKTINKAETLNCSVLGKGKGLVKVEL